MPSAAATDSGTSGLDLLLLGQCVRVTADHPEFLAGLGCCFEVASPPPDAPVDLQVHADDIGPDASGALAARKLRTQPADVLDENGLLGPQTPALLTGTLTRWAAATTRSHSVFHAGAVARAGRGVLLPGGSRSGKTTLTAALLQCGFELLSDEVGALIHETGGLAPYPRTLSVRHDAFPRLSLSEDAGADVGSYDSRFVTAGELGARRAEGEAELALVVAPRIEAGAKARLERLRPGLAAMTLIEASCSLRVFKEEELDRAISLARSAPCYELTFSELGPALDLITDAFEAGAGTGRP